MKQDWNPDREIASLESIRDRVKRLRNDLKFIRDNDLSGQTPDGTAGGRLNSQSSDESNQHTSHGN